MFMPKCLYNLLNGAVVPLHLSISFWVKSRRENYFTTKDFPQFFSESCGKPWILVMEHDTWYTIQMHNMFREQLGDGRGAQLIFPCPARNKPTKFTKLIHANLKCIKLNVRQPCDAVHGPILKLVAWYRQQL